MNYTTLARKTVLLITYLLISLLLIALLVVAFNLKDPHLLPYREYETAVLLVLSAVLVVFFARKARRAWRVIGLGALSAVLVLTLYGEGAFRYRRHVVLDGQMAGAQQLGQHFIIGYTTIDEIKPLVSQGLVGGVFITRRNSTGKSVEAMRQEISELQALRRAAGLPPLIITTDQEGGIVSRLSPPLKKMPPLASLLETSVDKAALLSNAEAYGQEQGKGLADLGVTVNFSPVVDLKSARGPNALDFHSLISRRAISADPALTAEVAAAYARGLRAQGVRATLKHFPGLGRVAEDTHHFSARLDTSVAELTASDWLPFRQIAGQSDALLMIGHVILTKVDAEYPASFSKPVVQGIIRQGWRHNGVLVTDDLTMNAAYSYGLCEATVRSLNAGVDLLLVSYDYEKIYEALYCASRAYEQGRIDRKILNSSQARLSGLMRD